MKKIYLVSPREPSGATWLINCFLELGIKTFRNSYKGMWVSNKDGSWTLSPHENILKKWLPSLTKYQAFNFQEELEVEWTHEWPTRKFEGCKIIYFIRDPRDSLYSRYKRENPNQSYLQFIEFPDPATLMDKIDNWCIYNYYWMSFDNISVFRFEDYKNDPIATLKSIIQYINLDIHDDLIKEAAAESTFEKAAEAEKKYLLDNPNDTEKINRSGKPGEWKSNDENKNIAKRIESRCAELLLSFGYQSGNSPENTFYLPNLSIFKEMIANPFHKNDIRYEQNPEDRILKFSKYFTNEIFIDSALKPYEGVILIESLIKYLNFYRLNISSNLSKMYIGLSSRANYHHLIFKITGNRIELLKFAVFCLLKKIYRKICFMINKLHKTKPKNTSI